MDLSKLRGRLQRTKQDGLPTQKNTESQNLWSVVATKRTSSKTIQHIPGCIGIGFIVDKVHHDKPKLKDTSI